MKIPKSNANRNKEFKMYIQSRRNLGTVPIYCFHDECPKLIKYGQKIRQNRCSKCEHFEFKSRF